MVNINLTFRLIILLITCQTFFGAMALPIESDEIEIVILFDEGHGQWFNSTNGLTRAIADIEKIPNVRFSTIKTEINNTALAGVDVFIITNPSREGSTGEFSNKELTAISNWASQLEKGLFLLSNPYIEDNSNLTGNPTYLNDILTKIRAEKTSFYRATDGKSANLIVKDDVNGNPISELTYSIGSKNLSVLTKTQEIQEIFTESGSLMASQAVLEAGYEAYGLDQNGSAILQNENPVPFGTTTTTDDLRVVVSASTLMFSDLNTSTGNIWYSSSDNSKLWLNSINWLADIQEPDVASTDIPIDFQIFLGSLGVAGLITITFGLLSRKKAESIKKSQSNAKFTQKEIIDEEFEGIPDKQLSKGEKKLKRRIDSLKKKK